MPPFLAPPTFEEGRRFRAVNARIERSFDPPSDKTARTKVARRTGYFLACAALLFLLCDSLSRLHAQLLSAGGERPSNELSAAFGSHSGQFFVHNVYNRAERSPFLSILEADPNYIRLDAMLLPVSCERIKQTLWRALGITGQWAGRIYVVIHQASSGEDLITITSERFLDGWRYRIELPSLIERSRYVHAMVQVILLEFANRKASDRSAEIPDWLSEGCCQQMLGATNSELEILLPPPQAGAGGMRVTSTTVNAHLSNRLEDAHQRLLSSSPLTFQQLSWPTQEQFSEEAGAVYRGSAQLLVADLLDLKDGPACLRAMLAELPKYYNWQFAFLHAFRAHFDRPLDVEKWWALQIVHFTGRDLAQTWAPDESWQEAVLALVQRAHSIILWLAPGQDLRASFHWEVEQIVQARRQFRTIIVLPPPDQQADAYQQAVNQATVLLAAMESDTGKLADADPVHVRHYQDMLADNTLMAKFEAAEGGSGAVLRRWYATGRRKWWGGKMPLDVSAYEKGLVFLITRTEGELAGQPFTARYPSRQPGDQDRTAAERQ